MALALAVVGLGLGLLMHASAAGATKVGAQLQQLSALESNPIRKRG